MRATDCFPDDGHQHLAELWKVIADELGESPEAWRGAGLLIQVLALVGSSDADPDRMLVTMAAIMEGLVANPAMPHIVLRRQR